MNSVLSCAKYLYDRYLAENRSVMDEMKMHKLLYFAQRESYIRSQKPLFQAVFYAWKFGPILKEIRSVYQTGMTIRKEKTEGLTDEAISILESIYAYYSQRDSWSLSRLTHGEFSWQNARKALLADINSVCPISDSDIMQDAFRVAERRKLFA